MSERDRDELIRRTIKSFDYQWRETVENALYLPTDKKFRERLVKIFTETEILISPEYFKGKYVLDAGAGCGRWTIPLAEMGANVVALDASPSGCRITRELTRTSNRGHVDVIIGDVMHLPFKGKPFDIVVSWGVLHHTGDTKKAFDNIAKLVKDDGILYVMIYGARRNKIREFNTSVIRKIFSKLPFPTVYKICKVLAFIAQIPIIGDVSNRFLMIGPDASGNFDALSTPINDLHTYEEVRKWFKENGFVNVTKTRDSTTKPRFDATSYCIHFRGQKSDSSNISFLSQKSRRGVDEIWGFKN